MLNETQARTMLEMQTRMNEKVNPEWIKAAYPYLRAVVVEGAEAIEHHGWKWWKKQDKDLAQLQMELIDIWHFLLSEILLERDGSEEISHLYLMELLEYSASSIKFDDKVYEIDQLDLISKLELLIALAAARRIDLSLFSALMIDCGMNWTELYCQYVGKNVLNFFRQDHGYKEGTYQKMWNGREDNEYLVDIMEQLDPLDESFKDRLYESLSSHYPS